MYRSPLTIMGFLSSCYIDNLGLYNCFLIFLFFSNFLFPFFKYMLQSQNTHRVEPRVILL